MLARPRELRAWFALLVASVLATLVLDAIRAPNAAAQQEVQPESQPAPQPAVPNEAGRTLTVVPFPFVFYQEETKFGGGGSLSFITRRDVEGARSENSGIVFIYTARNQYSVGVEVERYFDDERWHVRAAVGFEEFPADYFGVGNTVGADDSEVFTPRGFGVEANVEREFSGRWRTGPVLRARTREMIERVESGRLETERPIGWDGGNAVMAGWAVVHDGRDHVFYPREGWWLRAASELAHEGLGSDYAYSQHSVDLRIFRGLREDWPGAPILAMRTLAQHSAGSVPFDLLPTLGGAQLLRGYYGGRFRGRTLVATQAELRFGHRWRTGWVLFGGVGRVADGLSDLSFTDLHAVYGIGLRVQLSASEKLHVRADLGRSDEGGGGFYLSFLEAF